MEGVAPRRARSAGDRGPAWRRRRGRGARPGVQDGDAGQAGKLVLCPNLARSDPGDGATLDGLRINGLYRFAAEEPTKVAEAATGELVALGRLETVATGATISASGSAETLPFPEPPEPVYALAIATEDRKDDVKLSGAPQKLAEEDPSLTIEHELRDQRDVDPEGTRGNASARRNRAACQGLESRVSSGARACRSRR